MRSVVLKLKKLYQLTQHLLFATVTLATNKTNLNLGTFKIWLGISKNASASGGEAPLTRGFDPGPTGGTAPIIGSRYALTFKSSPPLLLTSNTTLIVSSLMVLANSFVCNCSIITRRSALRPYICLICGVAHIFRRLSDTNFVDWFTTRRIHRTHSNVEGSRPLGDGSAFIIYYEKSYII